MSWPTGNDYFEAMQHPLRRFCRPELQRARSALDARGKPVLRAGKWVHVYEMRCAGGHERWAIGCFTEEPQGLARRHHLINEHLQAHPAPSLVEAEFIEQGICIRGRWYPITRSRWVDGSLLNAYVAEYLDHPNELRLLADVWVKLAHELRKAGIAHGNLGVETVLAAPGQGGTLSIRLVDYDAIFIPAFADAVPEELGSPDFQHPKRSWRRLYNAEVDRFSQLVVLTALIALSVEGRALWDRYDGGDNLLFRHGDFQEPATSSVFRELWQSESSTVRALTGQLILASQGEAGDVPPLESVAECLRPGAARSALSGRQIDEINKIMDIAARPLEPKLELGDAPKENAATVDDFVLEVEDEVAPAVSPPPPPPETARPVPLPPAELNQAIMNGPPPLDAVCAPGRRPVVPPPPLPPEAYDHPLARTFKLDAWMPEEVAVVKLQGFVRDIGGEIIKSIPGYIRVHVLDERDLAQPSAPGLMSWLGLVPQSPSGPRVIAVMELNLVHKPSATRQLVAITLRLSPGPEDEGSPSWRKFCDKMFCELRGYLMGFA